MKLLKKWLKRLVITLAGLVIALLLIVVLSIPLSRNDYFERVPPSQHGKTVLSNVNLVDVVTGTIKQQQNIYLSQGKIVRISDSSLPLMTGFEVIELSGFYVSPGLIDSHMHLFEPNALARFLKNGVTTVRNMQGMPAHLRWKAAQSSGLLSGAKMLTASPTLNGNIDSGPFHQLVADTAEARTLVAAYKEKGFDLIKVYSDLGPEIAAAILDAAAAEKMPVSGHIIASLPLSEQMIQMKSIEHIEDIYQQALDYTYDAEKVREIARILIATDTAVTTTLVAFQHILQASEEGYAMLEQLPIDSMNPFLSFLGSKTMDDWFTATDNAWMVRKYAGMIKIIKDFEQAGVTLVMGTDTGPALTIPGYSVHEELRLMLDAGLSTQTILASATVNGAALIGAADSLGQVKQGYVADLLILKKNPLEFLSTLAEPLIVIQDGNLYRDVALEQLAAQAQRHSSFYKTTGVLLDHFWSLD